MPDPIVPPTPTITQPSTGPVTPPPNIDTSPGLEQVQKIFDRVAPMKGASSTPPATPDKKTEPPQTPAAPVEKPKEIPKEPSQPEQKTPPPATEPADHKLPSFLEEALRVDAASQPPTTTPPPPAEEDLPEEMPEFKTPEERKTRWKGFRSAYDKLKAENKTLRERGDGLDQPARERMQFLETQNKEMATVLTRMGVEQNSDFQQNIIRPLYAEWNQAARIVKESGGDPNELARAMTLQGKTQFEALDQLFDGMPESAKSEINEHLRNYKRLESVRQAALRDAPKTFEALRKKEMERQYAVLNEQRNQMAGLFDNAVSKLRDEAKVELLMETKDPEAAWWNDQARNLIETSRKLYLENTDMEKMAMACVLAPMADTYRKLWVKSAQELQKLKKIMNDRFGSEPTLSERPGHSELKMPDEQMKDDLKRPFSEVFLREFHRSRARGG